MAHSKPTDLENFRHMLPYASQMFGVPSFDVHDEGFDVILDQVNFDDAPSLVLNLKLCWSPPEPSEEEKAEYEKKKAEFHWKEQQLVHAAYVETVRERVKAMGQIAKRPPDDLRAEERAVVYHRLLAELVEPVRAYDSNPEIAHVTSELIRALFDVDNMLYFVAPDWWRPKPHVPPGEARRSPSRKGRGDRGRGDRGRGDRGRGEGRAPMSEHEKAMEQAKSVAEQAQALLASHSHQQQGVGGQAQKLLDQANAAVKGADSHHPPRTDGAGRRSSADTLPPEAVPQHLTDDDLVGWGGAKARGRDNYLVTEESAPAPLGASLGWLLQLDGDDRRNAFLNAPWVKAVIPIRAGKEEAALEWLTRAHVEGVEGLGSTYVGDEPELKGKTIGEAIRILARCLRHANTSAESTLQTETVYEEGFNPLARGFRATGAPYEIFDQWIEVLPTDQVVALEYTPKMQ
jgi:hypothetical protein